MKHTPGIAGKLFGTLGRNGINVIACAQGASETNISFVVDSKSLRKSLNVIHDSFFLSEYQVLNLFICGVGTVEMCIRDSSLPSLSFLSSASSVVNQIRSASIYPFITA